MDVSKDLHLERASNETNVFPCDNLPCGLRKTLWGRHRILHDIDLALNEQAEADSLKIFALHGLGGVGKTEIALNYASSKCKQQDAVLWVKADTSTNMDHSFLDLAKTLHLSMTDAESKDPTAAIVKVKNWLNTTARSWLMVLDNCEDFELLRQAWPAHSVGAVIVTSRNMMIAQSLRCPSAHVQPLDKDTGADMLLQLTGINAESIEVRKEAASISEALGGLPLALSQMGAFISQRQLPIHDFLPLYKKNAAQIDARKSFDHEYRHTLSTVWELALDGLSGDAKILQQLLAFFDPNGVQERLLLEGSMTLSTAETHFLQDPIALGGAEEVLVKTALIHKDIGARVISIHRSVQAVVMRNSSPEERAKNFDIMVRILTWGFPDRWSQDRGHQHDFWSKSSLCVSHVIHITQVAALYDIAIPDPQLYAELLLTCGWYLYEREDYRVARTLVDAALNAFTDKSSLAFASAIDLSGLILLDLNEPIQALQPFQQALSIREKMLAKDDPLIAFSLNNIALVYTETSELNKAYDVHLRAIDIRLSLKSDRIGNSYSNMASLLLKMGRADQAEEMLRRCPALKDFTDDTFLQTKNPRFSGDMTLLSRIRVVQDQLEEAVRLASKALIFRRELLGNGLKTCDSLYNLAHIMYLRGNPATTVSLLDELVTIAESLPGGQGYLAKANFKLSRVYDEMQKPQQSGEHMQRASEIRHKLGPADTKDQLEEADFAELCPWMLW